MHTFAGETLPFFSLSFTQRGDTGAGAGSVQAIPGPSAGQTDDFEVTLSFAQGDRAWAVGEDAEGTSATLTVDRNTTSELEGTINGTCATNIDGETVLRPFILTFRSSHAVAGAASCAHD